MLGLSRPGPRAVLGLALTTALISTISPPPAAAAPMAKDAAALQDAVQSLSLALDGVGATPTLQARLPLAGQSVSDVLGLDTLFSTSIGTAAGGFTDETLAQLVTALDGADTAGLGISATKTDSSSGSTITLQLAGKTVNGKVYALHADDTLFLDGTVGDGGHTDVTGEVSGSLVLHVTSGETPTVTLDPASTMSVSLEGGRTDLSVASRYGFSDVTAKGATSYDVGGAFDFTDPDGLGGITELEWQTTMLPELAPATISGNASVDLDLDSNLVAGAENGTLTQSLSGAAQMVPGSNGDGSYAFGAPTITAAQGLADLAKVTSGDAIVALAQMAAAYTNAQARIDPRLPLVDTPVSELGSAVKPLNDLVEQQGAAAVICGRADTSPPAATTVPGTTWYCQARTAEPIAGNVQWNVTGGGTITANATSTSTVGQEPTSNITVTGASTEPEVTVSFDVAGTDGNPARFTAQRRIQTAQELATRLSALPGGSATTAAYDATTRALTFPISTDSNPASKDLDFALGDYFRNDARLRGIETASKLGVDVGEVAMAGTLGLLLEPTGDTAVADRAFVKVASGPEVSVAGISTSGGTLTGAGTVGMVEVGLAGSGLAITTGTAPALKSNIQATGTVASSITNAAMLSDILAGDDDPASVATVGSVKLNAAGTLTATADELPSGSYTATMAYPVDLADTVTDTPPPPTVTVSNDWGSVLKPQDVAPQVSGFASSADAAGKTLTDSGAKFLDGALGPKLSSGDVLNLSLVNLRTGAACSAFKVTQTTLTCVEQDQATATAENPAWIDSHLAGGKTEDPTKLADNDNTNNYKTDNEWQAGDAYLVEGDPTAVRGLALGGLYDAADGIEKSEEAGWRSPVPVLGLTPHDLVPQLDDIRKAAAKINNLGDEVQNEDCGADAGGCPTDASLETAPATVKALEKRLGDALTATRAGSVTKIDVQTVDGKPAMVLDVTAPASGETELPVSFAVGGGTEYWFRRATDVAGDTTSLKAQWSSTVRLKVAVPTTPDVPFSNVKLLSGSGVTALRVQVGSESVDLNAGLGPVDVKAGEAGALEGTNTDPETNPLLRHDGTVTVAGKASAAGTTLTDSETKLANLVGTTGAETVATRTSDSLTCTAGAADGDGLECDLPDDTAADPDVVRDWAVNDGYTLTYSSATWLTDTSVDFTAKNVAVGDLIRTYTGDAANRQTEGVCSVKTVTKHQLECEAALSSGKKFSNGVKYRVLPDALVDLGAGFGDADLVGSELTNLTDGSSCDIASADDSSAVCEGTGLAGGTDNRWEPGDEYEVEGAAVLRADVAFTFLGSANALLQPYVAGMEGTLAAGPGAPVTCGTDTGAICLDLSVRTQPTDDRPSGQALGRLRYKATFDGSGVITETKSVSDAVKNLEDGTTPLALGGLGDAFADAGGAVADMSDKSTDLTELPMIGGDATSGSWLVPLLDAYGAGLGEAMMTGALSNLPEETPLDDIDGAGTTLKQSLTKAVTDAANEVLTPGGETMGDVTVEPVVKCGTSDCDPATKTIGDVTAVELPLKLGKTATYQVPFQAGLGGLPISADFRVDSAVDWNLNLTVGLNREFGPYVDLENAKLHLGADVDLPEKNDGESCPASTIAGAFDDPDSPYAGYNPNSCQALTLGILQATAYDAKGDERSKLKVALDIDLDKAVNGTVDAMASGELRDMTTSQALANAGVELKAQGRFNVYFVTGANPRVTGLQDGSLPSVHGTLDMSFNPDNKNVWDIDLEKDWSVEFERLYLDAGSFANNFAGDVIGGVAKQVKPYKPLIDNVRAPVPVISDIAMLMGKPQVSLIDILEKVSGSDLSFVRKVIEVLDVVAGISKTDKNLLIPLGPSDVPAYDPVTWPSVEIPPVTASGSFKMSPKQNKSGPCGGKMTANPNPTASGANGVSTDATKQSPAAASTERRMPKDCTSTDKGGGVLRGKTKVIQTQKCDPLKGCTGKERAATISAAVNKPKLTGTAITFPFLDDYSEIFGLLVGEDATLVRLDLGTLRASAGIGLKFGPFMAGPVPVDIGVGLSVTFGAHLALGYDTLGLRNALLAEPGEFNPSALLDGLYIDDYDAAGNETPEMTLTLAVQLEGAVSIKIFRVGIFGGVSLTLAGDLNDPNQDGKLRIKEIRAVNNPICLFELAGFLDFFFGFFVEVDLFIKKFRYDVTLYRLKPPIKLFEIKCEPKPPVLAVKEDGHLRLKMGESHVGGRNISEDEPKERFKLRQLTDRNQGPDGGTLVSVEAFGIYQEHVVPAGGRVKADAGSDNDAVDLLAGVDLQNKTHAWDVPATINGGEGNDTVTAGAGDDVLGGDNGDDRIVGNSGDDTITGGGGNDVASGGIGTDTMTGGGDNDVLSGDNGGDIVDGGADDDQISGGPGLSQAEYDKLLARWTAAPTDKRGPQPQANLRDLADTLSGGAGNDRITGHVGNDKLYGEEVVAGDFRTAACANDAGTGSGSDAIDGQAGDDWLAGGPSADGLTGGQGDDTLCGNGGSDALEGDEGTGADGTGQDELRGGSGDDRMFGRGGREYADGGPGSDMVATGRGADVALGGTGSDAVNSGDDGDVLLGDTGSVSGVAFNSATQADRAGVQTTGLTGTPAGKDLESKVSDADAAGTDGSTPVCTSRVVLLRGTGGAKADLDGNGAITSADDGRLEGYSVIDGQVDMDADGGIDSDDAGVVSGRVVTSGLVDVPADQALDALGWRGTGDGDCLFGADGSDAVLGGAAGDTIATGFGEDLAVGGAGDDLARGEDGVDLVRGSGGADTLYGDDDADVMLGNAGDDTAYGGLGSDQVEGNDGSDDLYGGEAADVLVGGTTGSGGSDAGDDVFGGEAGDFIAGDNAEAVLSGGSVAGLHLHDVTTGTAAGGDRLHGGADDDLVYGQGGADEIDGDSDEDTLEGGPAADEVHGGDDADDVTGGSGADLRKDGTERTWPATADAGDDLFGDGGEDTILGDNGVAARSELFDVPTAAADPSTSTAGGDTVSGGDDDDRIFGQSGNDALAGDAGDDVVDGSSGADAISGGEDDDDLVGGSSQAGLPSITGAGVDDRGRTTADGLRGDLIQGDGGDDVALGDNGRVASDRSTTQWDVEYAGTGKQRYPNTFARDLMFGGGDDDRLLGQGAGDTIEGNDGDDVIGGDAGPDRLYGGAGADDIAGGSGLAQAPTDLVGVLDSGDVVRGGTSDTETTSAADGADVVIGDNGRITRTGGTDLNTMQAVRQAFLYDVDIVGDSVAPAVDAAGGDTIRGDDDRDLVYGQGGTDTIDGNDGDDWLEGSSGSDTVHGNDDDDDVLGGSSNDVKSESGRGGKVGEAGKGAFPTTPNKVVDSGDRLWGDEDDDAVLGDNGRVDRVMFLGRWSYHQYLGQPLLQRKVYGARIDEGTGAYGGDEGHGGDGHDELYGQLGADSFEGNAGDDSLLGDLGEMTTSVKTGPSAGTLVEADGFIREAIDVAGHLRRTTTLYPNPSSVTSGGAGSVDVLLGGLGNDVIHGGSGNDRQWGNRSFDSGMSPVKESDPGTGARLDEDVIFGDHGDDQMWGGWGHDRMYGGHGADRLDMVTLLNGVKTGDEAVDFKGMDFMYGGWGPDGMQADWSKPSPDHGTDKMVDATGAYNGYFVCEGAYGGNSIMRLLSPAMQSFWQRVAADDGAVSVPTTNSSGWWELGMVFNGDRGKNANPTYSIHPAHFVCDS